MKSVNLLNKFTKILLNPKAVNTALSAEFGMYPIGMQALKTFVECWLHNLNSNENVLIVYC